MTSKGEEGMVGGKTKRRGGWGICFPLSNVKTSFSHVDLRPKRGTSVAAILSLICLRYTAFNGGFFGTLLAILCINIKLCHSPAWSLCCNATNSQTILENDESIVMTYDTTVPDLTSEGDDCEMTGKCAWQLESYGSLTMTSCPLTYVTYIP